MATTSTVYSCKILGKFDWSWSSSAGKWSTEQELYRYKTLYLTQVSGDESLYPLEVIETKSKVRGSGKAIVVRFESTDGKDFELLGWSLVVEADARE